MRRALGWIVLAAALALVGAAAAVGQQRARDRAASPFPSASSTGPRGLAAARMFLAATSRPSLRLSGEEDAPPAGAVVLLVAPRAALDAQEVAALLAHARAGGTLIWMAGPTPQPALERALSVHPVAAPGEQAAVPLAPHPLVAGLTLPVGAGRVEGGAPGTLPILGAGTRVAAVSIPAGRGEVLVFAGAEPLENARIGVGGPVSLLARLAARGTITFDERWLLPRGAPPAPGRGDLAAAVGQALLAAGVLLAARARRLGAIRPPPPEGSGRTARDYLASLAVLYRRAGAEEEIARSTWLRARRGLERRAGLPAGLPASEVAARLERRSPAAADAFRRGERAVGSGPGALLATCRAVDELAGTASTGTRRGGAGGRPHLTAVGDRARAP